jgi:hypothetical protein
METATTEAPFRRNRNTNNQFQAFELKTCKLRHISASPKENLNGHAGKPSLIKSVLWGEAPFLKFLIFSWSWALS